MKIDVSLLAYPLQTLYILLQYGNNSEQMTRGTNLMQ